MVGVYLQSSCKNTILLDGQVLAILIALDKKIIATSANAYLLIMIISLVAFVGYLLDVEFYVFPIMATWWALPSIHFYFPNILNV